MDLAGVLQNLSPEQQILLNGDKSRKVDSAEFPSMPPKLLELQGLAEQQDVRMITLNENPVGDSHPAVSVQVSPEVRMESMGDGMPISSIFYFVLTRSMYQQPRKPTSNSNARQMALFKIHPLRNLSQQRLKTVTRKPVSTDYFPAWLASNRFSDKFATDTRKASEPSTISDLLYL